MGGWADLAAEVKQDDDEMGDVSGYVGWSPRIGWYGGTAIEGESVEDTAVTQTDVEQAFTGLTLDLINDGHIAETTAGLVAVKIREWRALRAEWKKELERDA